MSIKIECPNCYALVEVIGARHRFSGLPVPPATPTERIITEDRKIIHRCKIPII